MRLRYGDDIWLKAEAGYAGRSQRKQGSVELIADAEHVLLRIDPRGDPAELISLDIAGQQLILEEIQIEEDQHSGQHDASADEKPLFLDVAAHQHDEQRDTDDQADAGVRRNRMSKAADRPIEIFLNSSMSLVYVTMERLLLC